MGIIRIQLILKNEGDALDNFGIDQMILKNNTIMKLNIKEPEKAKAESKVSKTMEAAGRDKDGQPVQAAMEVGLRKLEEQSGKANAGTKGRKLEL